ncbi:MAG TPA: tyrosine-type recombinase/integrase [Pseudonocardiaceae bacterium]
MSSTEPVSGSAFWALKTVSSVDGSVGWTVLDDEYQVQPQAAAFLYALRFAADRAEGTCRTYSRHLSLYFTWLAESRRDWRNVGAADLASFVLWLQRTPTRTGRNGGARRQPARTRLALDEPVRGASTVNGITTAVRELYGWLAVHDQVDTAIARRLSATRVRKKHPQRRPEVLADDQVQRLLEVCSNARDRFLVQLLWRCGLRLSEALGLRREDLHFLPSSEHVGCRVPGAHVHVIRRDHNENGAWAKSRWPRYVPAPREVVDAYTAYRWERAEVPAAAASDFVFVNLWGGTVGRALRPATVEDLFVRQSALVGFKARPHMLRHAFGTALAQAGTPVDVIQHLLGHAWITSTQVYLHPSWEQMRCAVERVSTASQGVS